MALKFNDFNLGDHKNHSMLAPHRYLTRTKGKNSRIIPQPWTMDLVQSTVLNVMKIPHFGRHQRLMHALSSCCHASMEAIYVARQTHHYRSGADPQDHQLSMQGPDPQDFYPGKATDCALAQRIKDTYGDVEKGT
jgi:hypothetical protein